MSLMSDFYQLEQAAHENTSDEYVNIVRTGAYLLPVDTNGFTHLGYDTYRSPMLLTLPGGNIEESDRNLYAAAKRETRQEFGISYQLVNERPIVILCDELDDHWVQKPMAGQRVKLRVFFLVIETHGRVPRQQRCPKPEVFKPMPYALTLELLKCFPLRIPTQSALTIAHGRGHWPYPPHFEGIKPNNALMRQDMLDLLVPPWVANYHASRSNKRDKGENQQLKNYLGVLHKASIQHDKLARKALVA